MARARFERLPAERRDAILDVAAAHFAEHGYEGASYNRILDDAGLSKSSAYYLFESKVDLYAAVLVRELADWMSDPVPVLEPYWDRWSAWITRSIEQLRARPRAAALLGGYADARRRGVVPNLDDRLEGAALAPLGPLIDAGVAAGAVRTDLDPELLVALAGAVLAVLDQHHVEALRGPTAAGLIERYVDTVRRLLIP